MSVKPVEKPNRRLWIDELARAFYEVVPLQYRTYCAFTSKISAQVLGHFGLVTACVPCQMLYTLPGNLYVIGFLGKTEPGKWDGHVVCCTQGVLIDAATHHFESQFGLPVPSVVVAPLFEFPSQALACRSLNEKATLWWQHPPADADLTLPPESTELVAQYAEQLIARLDKPGMLHA